MATKFKISSKGNPTVELKNTRDGLTLEVFSYDPFGKKFLLIVYDKKKLRKLAKAILAEAGE